MPESKIAKAAVFIAAIFIYACGCGILIWKSNDFQEQAELKAANNVTLKSKLEGLNKELEITMQRLEMYSNENASVRAEIQNLK